MKIRKATKKDLKRIAEIMRIEFAKPPFKDVEPLRAVLKSLNFYFKIGNIYVAVIEQKIVGVLVFKIEQFWEGRVIIIEDLAVEEKFKKQGVGKSLMNYIESYAKKKKIKAIYFITHKKSKAVKFYQKFGYKIKDNLCMKKNLK